MKNLKTTLAALLIATTGIDAHASMNCSVVALGESGANRVIYYAEDIEDRRELLFDQEMTYAFTANEWRSFGGNLKDVDGRKMVKFSTDNERVSIALGTFVAGEGNDGKFEPEIAASGSATDAALISLRDRLTAYCFKH